MIKTSKIKEPAFFKSANLKNSRIRLTLHFSQTLAQRRQSKFPINASQLLFDEIVTELLKKTDGKCAYCESDLTDLQVNIDHFRPQNAAADMEGKISSDHYWWLALKWNNLLPSCQTCNSNKKNYFPVLKKRATVNYSGKETLFSIEKPVLIDPEYENPEDYFYYNNEGMIFAKSERGRISIELLCLNREDLIIGRRNALISLEKTFIEIREIETSSANYETIEGKVVLLLKELESTFYSNKGAFIGIKRDRIRQYFLTSKSKIANNFITSKFKRKLRIKLIDDEDYRGISNKVISQFEIDTIKIKNYKSIDEITVSFNRTNEGKAGWAILIGENGVGKSSTLSATLKALIGRNYRNYRNFSFKSNEIKRGQKDASVNISFLNRIYADVLITDKIEYSHPKDYFINSSILAFGPFKHSNIRDSNYRKFNGHCFVDNFFNPRFPLHNALKFILQLTSEQFDYVAIAILDLLMLENKAIIHRKTDTEEVWYEYKDSGEKHYLNQLSDGYQSVITLGCNIIEGLLLNNESIENASGFVVIDEIGANLHPRWKMQIVKRLRRTFPNVQFLVTTHDPLCLKGIELNETYVLKSKNGELEVLTDLPNPSEYRAEQLLTSEFFGLYSTVDPAMEEDFKEYYDLLYLEKDTLKISKKRRLTDLKNRLRKANHLGDNFREELLYIAIDEILAHQKNIEAPFSRSEVVKEVKEKAIDLIDEFLSDLEE